MSELLGTQVGNIRITDLLGRGGMGDVYVGLDVRLNRKVAVKSIRKDRRLDDEAKVRFLREARVLSKLEHPNICRIHEYVDGEDSDLLVLELVEGRNLHGALSRGMKQAEALRVAEQIASVLEAAHAANVVHRDLKPENVMVTPEGQAKVLDFGISRSLDEDEAATEVLAGRSPSAVDDDPDSTMVVGASTGVASRTTAEIDDSQIRTRLGSVMGTVAYMAPEQARGEHVTAAADMYAFGLLLQEMLTGRPPMPRGEDRMELLDRASRGETEPVEGLGADLTTLINRLKSQAPGARPTAAETLAKLRWIRDKPKRRLRRLVIVAAVVAVLVAAVKYTVDLTRERNAAVAARAAEEQARLEAEEVVRFLTELFEVSDPGEARGNTVTARELLDRGAEDIGGDLENQPLIRARLMLTIGTVYRKLGLFEQAAGLLEQGLSIQQDVLADDSSELADSLDRLASVYHELGRYAEAERLYLRSLEVLERAQPDGGFETAGRLNNLANLYISQGRFDEAEPLLRRALWMKETSFGSDDPRVVSSLNNLANVNVRLGQVDEAEVHYKRALLILGRHEAPDHPEIGRLSSNLAHIYGEQGRVGEAEEMYHRAMEIQEKVYGADHPEVARTLNNLASLLIEEHRFADAEPLLLRAIPIIEGARGPQHVEVAVGLYNLGEVYREQSKYSEAEPRYRRSLAIFDASMGKDSPFAAYPMLGLANVARDTGRHAEAAPLYERSLAIRERSLQPGDDDLVETVEDFAVFLRRAGRAAEADSLEARFTGAPPE